MDDKELEMLLSDLESDRVERKKSASDKDKICEAICAFANDLPNHELPGVLFVGVNDDGTRADLRITDELLRELSNIRSDGNILPPPTMTVQKKTILGHEIAAVVVQPADAPPVRYKGRVWVRVGPRRATATQQEESRLSEKRRWRDLPFDVRPVVSATLGDLDTDYFEKEYLPAAVPPDVIEQNKRSLADKLTSLRFMAADGSETPTVLGILTIGKDPRRFFPGAYVQFLRIEGIELGDPIKDQKEISGPLPELLRTLDELFDVHVSVSSNISAGPVDIPHPDYPVGALRQLARNAVLHRTYEVTNAPTRMYWFNDRIEIHSPGGAYGQVTRENFGQPGITDYRNPHLAEAMKTLGYVQRFGFGIPLARKELNANGNPPPEFTVEGGYVLVVIRRRP